MLVKTNHTIPRGNVRIDTTVLFSCSGTSNPDEIVPSFLKYMQATPEFAKLLKVILSLSRKVN